MLLNKIISMLVFACVISLVSACSSGSNSDGEKEYKLQMSVTVTDTSTWYQAAEKLAEDLEAETDGRITVEVFPNEQLSGGDSGKAVELLSKGNIDLTFNSTIIYSILDERFGVASAPFLFKDLDEVDEVFNGDGGEALKEILREIGVEPLGYGQNGFRQVTNSVREIKTPEDIKGLKIRIPGITMYTDLWRELGANPSTMTFSEVFTSLQQNTIDGQENPIDVIHSSRLEEVQDYISMWNYSYDPLVLGINKKLFDSMSEEDQELITRLGAEAANYQVELARKVEAEQITELEEKGMQFYYPTEEELALFKETVQPVYDKYEAIWGADLLEAFTP
ncbi:DctP family TRAP transporter solute-binding subunit [Ornithinibacillus sp. BX22]|uniref:DctP family TRAP transporter solute-binding subunit n=2 Tax=Ornithinibacillus TaxID=484508 RepID=A0A923L3E3_9BACI|nr:MULTISPECIES: DctP family TRAP transporter solute-binding subunit [Ornithinibacillus]MBC5635754.1 DctP family TRAP transporter solute-binding subunit [Ornithinibacillus hominis]MBS3679364.1 DctP family TRAP transporter solute-binding subunit [Ornithinibacillus massiliensis]